LKKRRRQLVGKYVAVESAAARGDGAMRTMFGPARGAFTGAAGERTE
jgi:transcriptional regulatory protein RtcR